MNKNIWITADTHFSHGNIIKYCSRPYLSDADIIRFSTLGLLENGVFKRESELSNPRDYSLKISRESIDLMDDSLINSINKLVASEDTLWHLGDFAMFYQGDRTYYSRCKAIRDRIKCQNINIVWGNHDEPDIIGDLFNKSYDLLNTNIGVNKFTFCHYAMAIWNKNHRKSFHCYGHSHSQAEISLNRIMPGRRSMDVGVDNAFKIKGEYSPFKIEEIFEILNKRNGFYLDHHKS